MKGKFLSTALKLCVIMVLCGFGMNLYAENAKPAEAVEYIDLGDDDKILKYENPCDKKSATVRGEEFIGRYIEKKWNTASVVSDAEQVVAEIKAKKFEDIGHLASILDMSLFDWACKNGFTIRNTERGFYFFKKNEKENSGIFIGIRPDGYLHSEGVRQGRADLALDIRGRTMETYYLQVIISKLKHDPNEKHSKISDEAAQKILNSIIEHAYVWGMEYYGVIIAKGKK